MNDNDMLSGGGKEKESLQFLLEGIGVDGRANVDRKTVPCWNKVRRWLNDDGDVHVYNI